MVVAEATAQQRVGAPKAGSQAAAAGGCCCCCACCVSEPEALSWRHAFRSLHPLTLLRITGRSLSPRHHADLLALQLLAVAPAALLTPTGGDWAWAGLFRPASPTAIVLAGLALGLGMLVPPIVPLTLWCTARRRGDVALGARAIAVARVVVIGVVYVTLLKAITGRQHPPYMDENLGVPCVRTDMGSLQVAPCEPSRAHPYLVTVVSLMALGAARHGRPDALPQQPDGAAGRHVDGLVVPGDRAARPQGALVPCRHGLALVSFGFSCCPPAAVPDSTVGRGHTLSATALVVAVVGGPPRQGWLVAVGVAWVALMSAIMACTVHWVSDVLSGFCCGLAIALAVLREQRAAAAQP